MYRSQEFPFVVSKLNDVAVKERRALKILTLYWMEAKAVKPLLEIFTPLRASSTL